MAARRLCWVMLDKAIDWHTAMRPNLREAPKKNPRPSQGKAGAHEGQRARAKVEHCFHVVKCLFVARQGTPLRRGIAARNRRRWGRGMKLRSLVPGIAVAVPVLGAVIWQHSGSPPPAAPTVLSFRVGQTFEEVVSGSTYPVMKRSNLPIDDPSGDKSGTTWVT
jgi:hypothetical protein